MTRIVAGRWGGRRLKTVTGSGTRPTADRVREAMFSSLLSELGGFDGRRVLDLYAGTGALGLEALSRGAEHADLVESGSHAARVIMSNVRIVGAEVTLHRTTAERFVAGLSGEPYDLVILDPPYATTTDQIGEVLRALVAADGLTDDGIVVVERPHRTPFTWPEGLSALRDKAYGETHLWYGH